MKLAVSIKKEFDDYGALYKLLSEIDFTELVGVKNSLLTRYAKDAYKPLQEIDIRWNDIHNCTNVRMNSFGKPYNANAVKDAFEEVFEYADKILEIDGGAYQVPEEYKHKLINKQKEKTKEKRFKF